MAKPAHPQPPRFHEELGMQDSPGGDAVGLHRGPSNRNRCPAQHARLPPNRTGKSGAGFFFAMSATGAIPVSRGTEQSGRRCNAGCETASVSARQGAIRYSSGLVVCVGATSSTNRRGPGVRAARSCAGLRRQQIACAHLQLHLSSRVGTGTTDRPALAARLWLVCSGWIYTPKWPPPGFPSTRNRQALLARHREPMKMSRACHMSEFRPLMGKIPSGRRRP